MEVDAQVSGRYSSDDKLFVSVFDFFELAPTLKFIY